jgi:hypothetical protein
MKWFKHETNAHSNLKLQTIIDAFGLEGYGYYWACVELVGLQGEDYCIKNDKNWQIYLKKQLNISIDKQKEFLTDFANKNLIDGKSLKKGYLSIPKLAERCDEYTEKIRRRSVQGRDNVPLEENRRDKKRIEETALPDWLNKKAWEAWVSYRKEIKKTLTPTSIKLQLKMLSDNQKDHVQIIKNSITNGWKGLFQLNAQSSISPFASKKADQSRAYEKRVEEQDEENDREENIKNNDLLRKANELTKGLVENFKND